MDKLTTSDKLSILKQDLQILNDNSDVYLTSLLSAAEHNINIEGVTDDGSITYTMAVIQYAAWLFRKRGADTSETGMPRFLRYELNNLLFAQKAKGGDLNIDDV